MKNTKNNCGNSCGCSLEEKDLKISLVETADKLEKSQDKNNENPKLDPTHFGDWQVNCRTIDF
jgi:hypothetical protein